MPHKPLREAVASHDDYTKFIDELLDLKIHETTQGKPPAEGMDLMGQLVRSAYEAKPDGNPQAKQAPVLGRSEIKGNAFVMLVAGHETTANTIHFTLLQLAGNPSAQRCLQRDLDALVGGRGHPSTWDFEGTFNPLLASMVGACMNETLRLMPSVVAVPKIVTRDRDQPLVIDGSRYVVPRGAAVQLCAGAAHNHPRYWPNGTSRTAPGRSDILD